MFLSGGIFFRIFAKNVDPDQMQQNVESDRGQHCLLNVQEVS